MADPRQGATNYTVLQIDGQATTISSIATTVLLRDQNGNILWCTGTTVPTGAGYAISCLFSATGILWQNAGTAAAATFKPVFTATG